MEVTKLYSNALVELSELLGQIQPLAPMMEKMAAAMQQTWDRGGKLLIAGNGGSAADAMHFAEELVSRFEKDRRALAAIALCDPTVITCTANDFGYDRIFSRQVEGLGQKGDLLVLFSTSGNSMSIIKALELAKEKGLTTCTFLGRDGGKAKGHADIEFLIPHKKSHRIQECHKLIFHTLCEWADRIA
ncbi:MAG TPA: SIS domain-containing protein [Tepidisphaeraceae bacterium]|jgi:D-sedoheptulose 7-phosphate isomerase